ncbi:MAG: hypothetical protein U0835_17445 [Isosphaeraceae bacterium]
MTRTPKERTRAPKATLLPLLGLAALVAFQGPAARGASVASYLKNRQPPPDIKASEAKALENYLDGGPALWTRKGPPLWPQGLVLTDSKGALLNKPAVNYLFWKRGQNIALFDARHPRIAPLFQQYNNVQKQILNQIYAQYQAKTAAKTTATASRAVRKAAMQVLTEDTTSGHQFAAQVITPVPEPASIASMIVVFAAGSVWWHSRLRKGA